MTKIRSVASLYLSEEFGRFLVFGGIALALHWLSRFVLNWYISFGWAIVVSYMIGMLVAFVLNKAFVFPRSDRSLNFELFFFFFVNIAAFPLVWIIANVLGEWLFIQWLPQQISRAAAHGIAITFPVFMNFALHKFITFRETPDSTKKELENA
jgi:putative flippase GtrA